MEERTGNAESNSTTKYQFKDVTNEKKSEIMDGRNRENTQKSTQSAISQLQGYLDRKQLGKLDDIPDAILPDLLLDFYTAVQPRKKENYCVQTLKCIRAALNIHFRGQRNLNIITDTRFVRTNEMFKGVLVEAKKGGFRVKKPTPKIPDEDLFKIGQSFHHDHMNKPDPKLLQRNVLFYIIYFFCRHGRENLYAMTKDTFKI